MSVEALLKTKIEDVKEPSPLPSGEWELRCGGAGFKDNDDYDADQPADKFTNPKGRVYFQFVPVKPVSNVDKDAVNRPLELGVGALDGGIVGLLDGGNCCCCASTTVANSKKSI